MSDTFHASDQFDAIIVGSGAGGGVVAKVVATAGKRVLLLERGHALAWADVSRDHLRNHRLSLYGINTGPSAAGNPRVIVTPQGEERILPSPHLDGYHNNAMAVGGGTLVYGAQAWRYMPQDFRMASLYGIPDGSGLADWPISYEELAPDYDRAEQEIGVCGDASRMTLHGNRERPYPMPPMTPNRHPETLRTSDFMAEKAAQWLREAGAREVWTSKPGLHLSGGQHQAGTARMGHDPKTSVTDPFGRVHGHDNLFIADGSLHVTNGGFNPVLTIMALGYRVGRRVAETI